MLQRVKKLSTTKKVIGGLVVLLLIAIASGHSNQKPTQLNVQDASEKQASEQSTKTEVKTVSVKQVIPFETKKQNDDTLANGKTIVVTTGVNGEKTITYQVTYTDGRETDHQKISEKITKTPVDQVVRVGTKVAVTPTPAPSTKPASSCDPNYSGCVPIASDVDCVGGGGNGPAYVHGPVRVIGTDIYGLDRDHNGIACE